MKGYWRLLAAHPRILGMAMLLTFLSSFGQTFFISLFVPGILESLEISKGTFGGLYSLATLGGAGCLAWLGRGVDRFSLRSYVMAVAAGLGLAALALASVPGLLGLGLALFGLRLAGQGLLTHAASTTMARAFDRLRGRALSVSALGYPLGEAVLPGLITAGLALWNWRVLWTVNAAVILLVFLPLLGWILARPLQGERTVDTGAGTPAGEMARESLPEARQWTRGEVLRDWRFFLLLPALLCMPFVLTGFFLFQAPLAESRGWSPKLMAGGFAGFALVRIGFSLLTGPWVDRFRAQRVFPLHLLPMVVGLLWMRGSQHPSAAVAYLALAGASLGMAGPSFAALWAELYGTRHLGAIKALTSPLGILGTALSPVVFGFLLDRGVDFETLMTIFIAWGLLGMTVGFAVCHWGEPRNRD